MAGDGVGVPGARVPGGGGDHLVGADFALAQRTQCMRVPRVALVWPNPSASASMSAGCGGLQRRLSERALQARRATRHETEVLRPARPSDELTDEGAGAAYPSEVDRRADRPQAVAQAGAQLHDPVIVAVARGGGPAVGLRSAPVRFSRRPAEGCCGPRREPREPGVLPDQRVVELGAVAVELHPPGMSGRSGISGSR